jgi:hypothetical protein
MVFSEGCRPCLGYAHSFERKYRVTRDTEPDRRRSVARNDYYAIDSDDYAIDSDDYTIDSDDYTIDSDNYTIDSHDYTIDSDDYTEPHLGATQCCSDLECQLECDRRLSRLSKRELRQLVCSAKRNGPECFEIHRFHGCLWHNLLLRGHGCGLGRNGKYLFEPGNGRYPGVLTDSPSATVFSSAIFGDFALFLF